MQRSSLSSESLSHVKHAVKTLEQQELTVPIRGNPQSIVWTTVPSSGAAADKEKPTRFDVHPSEIECLSPTDDNTHNRRYMEILRAARWSELPPSTIPHIGCDLFPVILILKKRRRFSKIRQLLSTDTPEWDARWLMSRGWPLIRTTTMIVWDRGSGATGGAVADTSPRYHILSLVVSAQDDARNHTVASHMEPAIDSMLANMGPLKHMRGHGTCGPMVMEGIRQVYVESLPERKFSYYRRKNPAQDNVTIDEETHGALCATHFACLNTMERLHTPAYAANRLTMATQVRLPAMFPGIPPDMVASGSGSATRGYACAAHDDSAATGISETIMLHAAGEWEPLPEGHEWAFAIVDACCLYDVQAMHPCMIYLPGSGVSHGTLPTRHGQHISHRGIGSALVTKSNVVSDHAASWYAQYTHVLEKGYAVPKRVVTRRKRLSDQQVLARVNQMDPTWSNKRKIIALREQGFGLSTDRLSALMKKQKQRLSRQPPATKQEDGK